MIHSRQPLARPVQEVGPGGREMLTLTFENMLGGKSEH